MTCPVCQRPDLVADALNCPACDADLQGLRLVAVLRTVPPPVAPLPAARPWGLLAGTAVALLSGGWLLGHTLAQTPAIEPMPVAVAPTDMVPRAALMAARDSLRQPTAAPMVAAASQGFTYVVRRGDTLRGIAWRLYGRASLAERLQAENNIKEPKLLQIGRELHLFAL